MDDGQDAVQKFIAESVKTILGTVGTAPLDGSARTPRTAPLDIAIPIFNNAALLRRCLNSLLPTLQEGDRVWLLDDASFQDEIPVLMNDFSRKWPATHKVRNSKNLGFVGTANRALGLADRDVILLNSDTEVTAGWLEHLQACLQRNPKAGIVCPLSDRATILSVLPETDRDTRAELAAAAGSGTIGDVLLPTAVGFCMLIRRKLIEEIGLFSQAFAPAYGEENDFSMRALRAGWDILASDQACVFHQSGGSFGQEHRSELQSRHQLTLERLWPEYRPLVQSWWRDNPLRLKTERLAWQGDERTGVVHVLHRQYHVGGTERVARTLIRALGDRYRQTLLYPGETTGTWCDFELRSTGLCRELMLNKRWIKPNTLIASHGADLTCAHSERALARIALGSGARIVHFHHMLHWDSLLLPAIARALGCRVVISVHDFWFNCPVYNQLEHSLGRPCGRSHAQADARCTDCLHAYASKGLERGNPALGVAAFTQARHALIHEMLHSSDAILVPSHFIRHKLIAAYPLISDKHIHVEQHGVSVPGSLASRTPERLAGHAIPRIVAYFGGDLDLKGAGLVLHMARSLVDSAVTFRIHGRIKNFDPTALPPNVELHGYYNPDDVHRVMVDVDLGLLPSFYEESFSMVASECWAHGIPVLASDRGAFKERVMPGVNGWLVRDMAPGSWVRSLRDLLESDAIERCREQLSRLPVVSIAQSAESLHHLYQGLLELPALPRVKAEPGVTQSRFRQKLQKLRPMVPVTRKPLGTQCLGIVRDHWGTANYRVRFPLEDLARSGVSESSRFHVVRGAGFDISPVLHPAGVQRIAVQPFLSDQGLKMMEFLHREVGVEITLVVDDLWTALPRDNPVRALMPSDVPGRLRYAASLSQSLVLTSHELKRQLGLHHDNTHVINNALPEWIWNRLAAKPEMRSKRLRVGWAGAPQHAADLAFLEQVMKDTSDLADWVFMGMCPDSLKKLASEVHGMVPFDQYPGALSGIGLDLAIAPLADHEFNRCKSHLKALEFGILGVPVIASDLEPYRDCPVLLATADDGQDWTAKIRHLLENQAERLERGRVLRQWVLENHMMEHRRPDWALALGIQFVAN